MDIKKVEKAVKKKKADFPEQLIQEITEAAKRHELKAGELDELVDTLKKAYERAEVESGEAVGTVAASPWENPVPR